MYIYKYIYYTYIRAKEDRSTGQEAQHTDYNLLFIMSQQLELIEQAGENRKELRDLFGKE